MAEDNYITKVCGVKIKDAETSSKVAEMTDQINDVINDYDEHFEKSDEQISKLDSTVSSLASKHEADITIVKQGLLDEQSAREDFDGRLPSCFMGTDIDKAVLRRIRSNKDGYVMGCFPVLEYDGGDWPCWFDSYGEEQAYISEVYLDLAYYGDTEYEGQSIYHISNAVSCDYDIGSATVNGVTTVTKKYWFKVPAFGGYNKFCLVIVDTTTSGAKNPTHLMYFDSAWDWEAASESPAYWDIGVAEYDATNGYWPLSSEQAAKFNDYIDALNDTASYLEVVPVRITLGPTASVRENSEGCTTLTGVPSWSEGAK